MLDTANPRVLLLEAMLRISDAVPAGVVASEKGAWIATSETGQTISALVSADAQADLAKGACYNDTAVELEAWSA